MLDPRRPLRLAPDGTWRRDDGSPWSPAGPFYAVLGDPIAHSLSPLIQSAALRARDLPHAYLVIRVAAGELARFKRPGAASGLIGFNVTAPLKAEASGLCDALTAEATRAGAVNCVRAGVAGWEGHNTDVGGIRAALAESWNAPAPPEVAHVLGTGGAARAAVLALLGWGARRVVARCRTPDGGRRFRRWLDECAAPGATAVAVEPLAGGPQPCPGETAVWVAALAAGVAIGSLLPSSARSAPSLLLDLRYGDALPSEPPPPLPRVDGRGVLLAQGGLAFGWWFGEPVPRAAMRAALSAAGA